MWAGEARGLSNGVPPTMPEAGGGMDPGGGIDPAGGMDPGGGMEPCGGAPIEPVDCVAPDGMLEPSRPRSAKGSFCEGCA